MDSKLTSKEIRAMNFNATWNQYFDLLQEIAARMAEQAERTPTPEAASADEQFVAADAGVSVESVREAFAEPAAPPSDALRASPRRCWKSLIRHARSAKSRFGSRFLIWSLSRHRALDLSQRMSRGNQQIECWPASKHASQS